MKAERRLEAKDRPRSQAMPGEDPDIAGIVPGPQPPREDQLLFADVVEEPGEEKPEV
jgi:hypothetical protein